MRADRKKNQIILYLFLFHFVIYAISPLSHIGPFGLASGDAGIEQKKALSFKNVEIFFLDIFFSNFAGREDTDNSNSRLILFKKIRAVVQSVADTKYKLVKVSGNIEGQPVSDIVSFAFGEPEERTPKPNDGYLAFFSGLSPPPV